MSDLMASVIEIREREPAYLNAADYYDGTVGEIFASAAVRRALRGAEGGFDINLAKRAVDAVLDRVRILAVSVPDNEALTRRLVDEVWTPNRMDRYSKTVHQAALVHGDAYLIVWPNADDTGVEMHYNGPVQCRVFYDPENPRLKSHAAKLWCEGVGDQRYHRLNLYYPDRIERWVTAPGKPGNADAEWTPYVEEDGEAWPLPNPYGIVPVFHFRTGEPYGKPEHRGAYGPQNAVTKLSATLISTVDFQAFPQRFKLTKMGELSPSQVFDDDDDPETAPGGVLEGGPGRLLELTGDSVGQFDPANMDAFLNPLGFYIRAMAAATATPLRFFDPQGQVPSGEALRADEAPLAQRIVDREEMFTEEWQEALTFACHVAGFDIPAPDIKWKPVQTVDDAIGWQTVSAKMAAGVPAVQALTEAGYTSDLVEGWLDGSASASIGERVNLLSRIGSACMSLGSAVQLGAISQETVAAIMAKVIGEVMPPPEDGDEVVAAILPDGPPPAPEPAVPAA